MLLGGKMDIIKHINENLKKTVRFNQKDEGELLGLPYPYTVPCAEDTFRCMYYWDTYFTNLGLIVNGQVDQAKYNADNMLFLIEKYGFMPNGNMTRYLNRSQPPFLFLMVKDVYTFIGDKQWLASAYSTLAKEYAFWMTERRAENGLNFYGNFKVMDKALIDDYCGAFENRSGGYTSSNPEERLKIANTFMAFCESGWDCCSRFDFDGEFYNPVDLNSLLCGFEITMGEFAVILDNGENSIWQERANLRKQLMDKFLWSEKENIYLDWNFREGYHSKVKSIASLYPLFLKIADGVKGEQKLIEELLLAYGVACSVKGEYRFSLQWDYPNIWAPLQYVAFAACKNYGLNSLAEEIAKRYIKLIEKNFEKTGNLWEKYDGNTGEVANQDYKAPTMMGWTAGVYLRFKEEFK